MTHDALTIEGIDTAGALKRLGNKRERYEALLRKFAEKQSGSVVTVRTALAAGDRATAERELHSLRGAAGSLGVIAIAETAGECEHALREGGDVESSLKTLEKSLAASVAAIRSTLPD
ncbi:Hpt domain-containing protein [Methyloceanibacter sp.]|uniref:Hpt domain-containing protein n=1 Tax=Methyloceanibacter sp. TaxID=1965321 RepID=UPI003D6C9C85